MALACGSLPLKVLLSLFPGAPAEAWQQCRVQRAFLHSCVKGHPGDVLLDEAPALPRRPGVTRRCYFRCYFRYYFRCYFQEMYFSTKRQRYLVDQVSLVDVTLDITLGDVLVDEAPALPRRPGVTRRCEAVTE